LISERVKEVWCRRHRRSLVFGLSRLVELSEVSQHHRVGGAKIGPAGGCIVLISRSETNIGYAQRQIRCQHGAQLSI